MDQTNDEPMDGYISIPNISTRGGRHQPTGTFNAEEGHQMLNMQDIGAYQAMERQVQQELETSNSQNQMTSNFNGLAEEMNEMQEYPEEEEEEDEFEEVEVYDYGQDADSHVTSSSKKSIARNPRP